MGWVQLDRVSRVKNLKFDQKNCTYFFNTTAEVHLKSFSKRYCESVTFDELLILSKTMYFDTNSSFFSLFLVEENFPIFFFKSRFWKH